MAEHTPGPWQIDEPHKEYVRIIGGIDGDAYDDGTPRVMYTHVCDVLDNDNEQANARLIAASPELLEACEAFVAAVDKSGGWHSLLGVRDAAVATIKKAKGGSDGTD